MLPKVIQSIGHHSVISKFIGLSAFEVLINHYEGDLEVFFLSDQVRQVFVEYLENQIDKGYSLSSIQTSLSGQPRKKQKLAQTYIRLK